MTRTPWCLISNTVLGWSYHEYFNLTSWWDITDIQYAVCSGICVPLLMNTCLLFRYLCYYVISKISNPIYLFHSFSMLNWKTALECIVSCMYSCELFEDSRHRIPFPSISLWWVQYTLVTKNTHISLNISLRCACFIHWYRYFYQEFGSTFGSSYEFK